MASLPEYAIIVAGGQGVRMGGQVPKQFLELKGLPIILHTLKAFLQYSRKIQLVVVLPQEHLGLWEDLTIKHQFDQPVTVCSGGESRTDSVRRGLKVIETDGLVAIHDAVRPLVDINTVADSFRSAREQGSGVTAVDLKDSLRQLTTGHISVSVDRNQFKLVQTPQTFQVSLIKAAYEAFPLQSFSDDATVFEKAGNQIFLVQGAYTNIKITTREDLFLAEAIMGRA